MSQVEAEQLILEVVAGTVRKVVSNLKYLWHSGIAITTRYIRLVDADVAEAHRRGSPVDRAGW